MDSGEILLHGKPFQGHDPISAKQEGIGMVYQELNLIPHLKVYENYLSGKGNQERA